MTKYSPWRRTGADAVGGSARAGLNAAVRRRRRSEPHAHFPGASTAREAAHRKLSVGIDGRHLSGGQH